VVVWGWRGVELGVSTGCGRLDGARPPPSGARVATYDGASVQCTALLLYLIQEEEHTCCGMWSSIFYSSKNY
jgi:hypothetical protein